MKAAHILTGRQGEVAAQGYLQQLGYRIVETNYRSGRWGEIDIICLHQQSLVFIEVKTRRGSAYGPPVEAVTKTKRAKLRRAAEYYKLTHINTPDSLRLDVVCVEPVAGTEQYDYQLYQNVEW
jgi:putative endonuclease